MSRDNRVPMKDSNCFIAHDDISASIAQTPRYGYRFSLDVAEDVLQRMGPHAVQHVVERVAERAVFENQHLIHDAVHSFLFDRAWAEPVIHDAITRAVRECVYNMMGHRYTP